MYIFENRDHVMSMTKNNNFISMNIEIHDSKPWFHLSLLQKCHYNEVIMGTIASQITSLTIVYSIVYSDADHKKHQSSMSLAFVRGIHWGLVNSPHKWPVPRKMFPFNDVIMDNNAVLGQSKGLEWC